MADKRNPLVTPEHLRATSEKLRSWPDQQSDVGPAHAATILAWAADEIDALRTELDNLRNPQETRHPNRTASDVRTAHN